MNARGYPSRISKKRADAALVNLLYGATVERLLGFTAASERRLSARKGRGSSVQCHSRDC
jgi:hypothetical protein